MDTRKFFQSLQGQGVEFFTGVPDSTLKDFIACIMQNCDSQGHIIAANEGNCIGLAMGHYLAKGKPAVVYMQNSGLGNAINPITSLADTDVYGIPMLLIIGWRGKPDTKDEPQHIKQGRITLPMLDLLEIPYVVGDEHSDPQELVSSIWTTMLECGGPAAIVLPKKSLSKLENKTNQVPLKSNSNIPLYREDAINALLDLSSSNQCFVATTGKTGRELFELRKKRQEDTKDFLTVGGMGHTASIATGIALADSKREVICLDGDGSLLMHMGSMTTIGMQHPKNFIHILLNNECHESVGGAPTVAGTLDFRSIALACGYAKYYQAQSLEDISNAWANIKQNDGPHLLEVTLWKGARKDLGRPTSTPAQNKQQVMEFLQQ